MDYRDHISGMREDFFWLRAKRDLIASLLGKLPRSSKTLVVGSGTGSDLSAIKRFADDIYVVDIEPEALNLLPDALVQEKKLADVSSRLPYAEGFFDAVLAFDVLEHIEGATGPSSPAIREIHRVLKPGGAFVFTVPAFGFLFSAHDRALGHYRRYDKKSLRELLKNFVEVELGYWVFMLFLPVAIQRLLKRKSPPKVHYRKLPESFNNLLYKLLSLENYLIKRGIPLPFGTTIFGIALKD